MWIVSDQSSQLTEWLFVLNTLRERENWWCTCRSVIHWLVCYIVCSLRVCNFSLTPLLINNTFNFIHPFKCTSILNALCDIHLYTWIKARVKVIYNKCLHSIHPSFSPDFLFSLSFTWMQTHSWLYFWKSRERRRVKEKREKRWCGCSRCCCIQSVVRWLRWGWAEKEDEDAHTHSLSRLNEVIKRTYSHSDQMK